MEPEPEPDAAAAPEPEPAEAGEPEPEAVEPGAMAHDDDHEEGVPPAAATECHVPEVSHGGGGQVGEQDAEAAYDEYTRDGISLAGLLWFVTQHAVDAAASTSQVCQTTIKPLAVPPGWVDEPQLITTDEHGRDVSANCWYTHTYLHGETGERQDAPPPGTRSMCAVLKADDDTARFVGRPTHFLSHAWTYLLLGLVGALESFVARLPEGAPEPFFWFDCMSLDQHAQSAQGSEWWRGTFLRAIGSIGHTVMVLQPWDSPLPLKRAWCLWELYCSHQAGVPFSVCLGPAEQRAFEAAILEDFDAVVMAFSQIDVATASAARLSDQEAIRGAVEEEVGFARLNAIAIGRIREWVFEEADVIAAEAGDGPEGLRKKFQIAVLFKNFGRTEQSKALWKEVIEGRTALHGRSHPNTLAAVGNYAELLRQEGTAEALAEAKPLFKEVIEGKTAHYGRSHPETLRSVGNYANLLLNEGTAEARAEAKPLYKEVIEGETAHYGRSHLETLTFIGNYAILLKDEGTAEALAEAKPLYKEVIEGKTAHYGRSHPETLRSVGSYAILLKQEGTAEALAEAKLLYKEAMEGKTAQLGRSHPSTLLSVGSYADLVAKEGTAEALTEAQALLREVVTGFEAQFPPSHPWLRWAKGVLARAEASG